MMDNQPLGGPMFSSSQQGADFIIYPFIIFIASIVYLSLIYYLYKYVKLPLKKAELYALYIVAFSLIFSIPYFYLDLIQIGIVLLCGSLLLIPYLVELYYKKPVIYSQKKGVEDLSREREKIFQLLENGKINVQEAKELLNAIYEPIEKSNNTNGQESYHRDTIIEEKPVAG